MKKILLILALAPNLVLAKVEITPKLLGQYLTSQGQFCEISKTFSHGSIEFRGKNGNAWSVECMNKRSYVVAVEHDDRQTAWWLTCENVAKYTRYTCFKH